MTEPVNPSGASGDIDALARRLPRRSPSPEASLAMRRAVLEAAEAPRRWQRPGHLRWWLGAAAAAAAVWAVIALRAPNDRARRDPATDPIAAGSTSGAPGSERAAVPPGRTAPGDTTAKGTPASGITAGPEHGRLPEGVHTIEATYPVQVAESNATVTAPPGARFDVDVREDRIVRVAVKVGWVVVASENAASTMVIARQTWVVPAAPGPSSPANRASALVSTPPASPGGTPPAASTRPRIPTLEPMGPSDSTSFPGVATPSPPVPPPPSPSPASSSPSATSEQSFRDGLRALLAGDLRSAVSALERACGAPSSIQQDICYWSAVAWRRAGDRARARAAFADVLERWPHATHAGEAHVGLGWLLLDAGERSGARMHFAAAAGDPTPSVRTDALRGLSAAR